jgi:hypothetical protein
MNGQNYAGNFDFIFTADLVLHRCVPMSGPVQGKTKTQLIGTGLKPIKKDVELKWGAVNTDFITRETVKEYVYQKASFENIIDGNEVVKAYTYEATMF